MTMSDPDRHRGLPELTDALRRHFHDIEGRTADPPEARYCRDPAFASLVDYIESAIARYQYTPTEVREAAMLAAIRYETRVREAATAIRRQREANR